MAWKVNWTPKAWQTFNDNITYLKENWTEKEIIHFVSLADEKIINLHIIPELEVHGILNTPTFVFHLWIKGFL